MQWRYENPEASFSQETILRVGPAELEALKARARANPSGKARLCAHHDPGENLHEMLIVHQRHTFVRPHRHPDKTKSYHIIEGLCDVLLFDDAGNLEDLVEMGPFHTGRTGYFRLTAGRYHSVLVRSDALVFHETTQGPFRRDETSFVPGSPDPADGEAVARYMEWTECSADAFKRRTHRESQ